MKKTIKMQMKTVTGTTKSRKYVQSYRRLRIFYIYVSIHSNSWKMRWIYSTFLISFSNIVWRILCLRVSQDI